jgi:hypothetical protein
MMENSSIAKSWLADAVGYLAEIKSKVMKNKHFCKKRTKSAVAEFCFW